MILINGSPNVGDDLTAISNQITVVEGKVDAVDNFVDTEVAAIKAKTDNLPVDPADQSNIDAKLGATTDFASHQTLLGYQNSLYQHVHKPAKVYPSLAAGVTLTGAANPYVLGAIAEIIPANTITNAFDIHWINVEAASATDVYEIVLYKGAALSEVEIGRVRVHKNSVQSGANNVPIQIPAQAANERISAAIASASGGSDTLTVSVMYHEYL